MFGALCRAILPALPLFILFLWIPAFAGMTNVVSAEAYFFSDEFNEERTVNTLNPDKWTVFPNAAAGITTIHETGGNFITSQSNFTNQYPLVTSKVQAFPAGDFQAEVKFQYTEVTNWGTGIAFSDKDPNNLAEELLRIDVWQDNFIPNMRIEYKGQMIKTIPNNINPHILKVERIGLKYLIYLDGNLVFTSPETSIKPKVIWIGNPTFVQPDPVPVWTKFNVDYIRVKALPTPLILIPGIGGSEFKVTEDTFWSKEDGHGGIFSYAYSTGEKVWVNTLEAAKPGEDDYFDILRMKSDGVTPEANLNLTGELFSGAYQETINFFTENGYELNETLFIFPYDWRKDISLTAPLLDQKINQIKEQTGSQKVDIVAHSMGGLVARNYISDTNRAGNVRKLITLGTPHLGSVEFLKNLRDGGCLKYPIGPFCITLAPSELKDVIQNMTSGFQLVSSQKYFEFYNGNGNIYPFPFRDDADIDSDGVKGPLDYNQTKTLLTNLEHNTALFSPTETFHQLDNSLNNTNGVEVINIVGSSLPTLGQIIEKYALDILGIKIPEKDEVLINGDNTVPLFSASLIDPVRNLSLLGNAKVYYTNQKHGSLVTPGPALNLIRTLLSNNTELPEGIFLEPFKLKGRQLSVHSPVNIHVYDSNGKHTGPTSDGDFEVNIPGSLYDTLDDAKFIWLPYDGIYNIVFEATGEGSFDFKIRKFEDDINTESILYEDIPIDVTSQGQTTYDTSSNQFPVLEIDNLSYNYFNILDENSSYDHTNPEVSFDVTPKIIWPPNGKMVDVNITGNIIDENPYLINISVDDEYDVIEPTLTSYNQTEYSQTIKLEASRKADDKDGRLYKINILVKDLAGNTAQQQFEVIVPHDQR